MPIKRLVEKIAIYADNIEIGLTEAGRDLFVDAAPSGAVPHRDSHESRCGRTFRLSRAMVHRRALIGLS